MKLMQFTSYLFIASILSSCGMKDPRTISGVNPAFNTLVNEYVLAKGSGLDYDIPMQFAHLPEPKLGVCTRWAYGGYRQIQIDIDGWEKLSDGDRRQTIFHELGHCDLNREHNTHIHNGAPVSIMFPEQFFIAPGDTYYITELFNPKAGHAPDAKLTSKETTKTCVKDILVE